MRGAGGGRSLTLDPRDPRVIRFTGAHPGDEAGTAVAAGGDLNGDGYRDLLIGAPGGRGTVHAIYGGPRLRSRDLGRLAAPGSRSTATAAGSAAIATRRLGDFAATAMSTATERTTSRSAPPTRPEPAGRC